MLILLSSCLLVSLPPCLVIFITALALGAKAGYTAVAVLDGSLALRYRKNLGQTAPSSFHPRMTMTKAVLDGFRQQLLALRSRLKGDATQLADEALRKAGGDASGSLSNMPIHMADLGTDNFEQEFTLSLLQNEEQVLQEIAAALERLRQ